jgi:L-alanine-DL-glutamate epimerase-like enolase superfamily enzyme
MTKGSLIATASDTYAAVATLPIVIESYRLDGLSKPWSAEFIRRTTVVTLEGEGHAGVGEDVTYTPDDHGVFQGAGAALPLAGRFTLASFSAFLDELELFPRPPRRQDSLAHRRWAFESAALDLALRQAGVSLAEALGRVPAPVRFVVSMRLPEPPSIEPVLRRLELYPDLRFKLDVTGAWDDALIAALADRKSVV